MRLKERQEDRHGVADCTLYNCNSNNNKITFQEKCSLQ